METPRELVMEFDREEVFVRRARPELLPVSPEAPSPFWAAYANEQKELAEQVERIRRGRKLLFGS